MRHAFLNLLILFAFFSLVNCNERKFEPRKKEPAPSAGFSLGGPADGRGKWIPSKPGGPTVHGTTSCIADLKQKTADNKLRFVEEAKSQIDDQSAIGFNEQLEKNKYSEQNFSVSRILKDGQIESLDFKGSLGSETNIEKNVFSISIEGEDSDSNFAYSVNLSFERQDSEGRKIESFSQVFNVNSQCQLQLKKMQKTKFEYIGEKKIKVHYFDYYQDTGDKEELKEFVLKENEYLKNSFGDSIEDLKKTELENGRVFFSREIPFARIKVNNIKENLTLKNELTHTEAKGYEISVSYMVDDVNMLTIRYQNAEPLVSRTIYTNKENLKIDKDIWMQLTPKSAVQGSRVVEVNIASSALNAKDSLTLNLTYENEPDWQVIEPYWKVLSKSETEARIRSRNLTEKKSIPLDISFDSNNQFLQKTEFIQTDLVEIQNWSKKLKKNFDGTRLEMAKLILNLISETLVYDHSSVKNNIIRPLNTKEIVDHRTGVCQHYANLFVTLARSVGLPSRIIVGYLLAENHAGPHAWVEIETEPNRWLPIEPQSKELLTDFKKYLPIAISGGLDDPKNARLVAKEIKAFSETMKISYEH